MHVKLAYSKSGHDKGQLYAVVAQDESFVYLADGKYKTCEKPKKKNRKHIQPVISIPEHVSELLKEDIPDRNTAIKRAIKIFEKDSISQEDDING